ncbi:MAG: hypothetical protein LBU73_07345 [Helicobacteraceae bacterium]|jgi:hypothetical protein|nr:hypothetical protein [Helicobacteraceae bacterium]
MEISRVQNVAFAYAAPKSAETKQTAQTSNLQVLSDEQKSIKEQSLSLQNDNEIFGAIKTTERALIAISAVVSAAKNGEISEEEARNDIKERVENAKYKGANLFENFPLADGTAVNMRSRLDLSGDLSSLEKNLSVFAKENGEALSAVKTRIMGGAEKLGASAQNSYEKSGLNAVNPASIVANTNVDYLKAQFAKLMG